MKVRDGGGVKLTPPQGKSNLKKPSLIRVKPTVRNLVRSSFLEAFKVFTVSLYSS